MYHHVLVLASLACIVQGLPVEFSTQHSQARPVGSACTECSQSELKALATLLQTFHPAAAFRPSHQGAPPVRASPAHAKATPAKLDTRNHRGTSLMAEATAKAGAPGKAGFRDMQAFQEKPDGFCKERLDKYGSTFVTGAYGGATFCGDGQEYSKMAGSIAREKPRLAPPFAVLHPDLKGLKAEEIFDVHQENFNFFIYDGLLRLIPPILERGFAPVVDLQPVLEERPRKLKEVLRKVLFLSTAPYFFGVKDSLDLSRSLGMNSTEQMLNSYVSYARFLLREGDKRGENEPPPDRPPLNSFGFSIAVKQKLGLGYGDAIGNAPKLKRGVYKFLKENNFEIDGDELMFQLASSIEQTVSLTANMMGAGRKHELIDELREEFLKVMKGKDPKAGFTIEDIDRFTLFDSFSKEVMRVYPPARPSPRIIGEPLDGDGYSLPAGTLVAPEPFVAHFDPAVFDDPTTFRASRFEFDSSNKAATLIPFASGPDQVPGLAANEGEKLMVLMAKVTWQHFYRMFVKVGWAKYSDLDTVYNPIPGYPLNTLKEQVSIFLEPRAFYLMQRPITFNYLGWGGVSAG